MRANGNTTTGTEACGYRNTLAALSFREPANLSPASRSHLFVPSEEMPIKLRTCRCVTLHTYPAYVTADSWHVVVHVCECGREHFSEPIPRRSQRRLET